MAAVNTAVFTVSVELIEPVDDTVTGEKLHVAPADGTARQRLVTTLNLPVARVRFLAIQLSIRF